jgi:hypothetical protein
MAFLSVLTHTAHRQPRGSSSVKERLFGAYPKQWHEPSSLLIKISHYPICDKGKIVPVLKQALRHEDVLGE